MALIIFLGYNLLWKIMTPTVPVMRDSLVPTTSQHVRTIHLSLGHCTLQYLGILGQTLRMRGQGLVGDLVRLAQTQTLLTDIGPGATLDMITIETDLRDMDS